MYVIFGSKEIESLPSNNILKPASDVAYNNTERLIIFLNQAATNFARWMDSILRNKQRIATLSATAAMFSFPAVQIRKLLLL